MKQWAASSDNKSNWFEPLDLESINIFDSQIQTINTLELNNKVIPIYVCGLTPYDSAHLGHAFTYSLFDLLVRFLRHSNKSVKYVQNITDVDDPLFERARRDNQDWQNIATSQIDKFVLDMKSLGINPPDVFTPVSDEITSILKLNEILLAKNEIYPLVNDWYYKIKNIHHPLVRDASENDLIQIFSERGGDPYRTGKENPLDPVVWKQSLPDEPAWNSELGSGRPGWHIECVAIIEKYLDLPLLIQGGGKDLLFPHHTMCALQTRSLTGKDLAQSYMHAGLVSYQGEKMSKSLGNLVFISDLIDKGFTAAAIRVQLLGQPWNQDWEWFEADLSISQERVTQWKNYVFSIPVDNNFLEFTFDRLRNNLDTESIFKQIDAMKDFQMRDVKFEESIAALLADVFGIFL